MKRISAILLSFALICALLVSCNSGPKELTDGTYTVEVELTGGSGKSSVDSPATVVVSGGTMTAILVWNSPYYEYMLVDGVRYDPIQTEGNSTFEIPVVMDADMEVSASTIAMSEPHLIDYTLHFDSSSAKGE